MNTKWLKHRHEVLDILKDKCWIPGRSIREALNVRKPWWRRWGYVDFYRLMAIMEDEGEVIGEWREYDKILTPVIHRVYTPTDREIPPYQE